MILNGKLSYTELEQLIFLLKDNIINTYLKKIYHYDNMWLFKFNNFSFTFEPGVSLWPGSFSEREKVIHSVCSKIRKEVGDNKVIGLDIVNNDRTVVIQFYNHKIILELYAKGNLILLNNDNNIIVLTRIYTDCSHGKPYMLKEFKSFDVNFNIQQYNWIKKGIEFGKVSDIKNVDNSFNILQGLQFLWDERKINNSKKTNNKKKNKKKTKIENINDQISNLKKKIDKKRILINNIEDTDCIDYSELGKLYKELKIINNKFNKAEEHLEKQSKDNNKVLEKRKKNNVNLINNKWYQKYHWWYTKNNFLVIGGKNSDDNEKIVKNYLNKNDYYFHSEDPGSGSFIMITENRDPEPIDIDETAEGVLALSNQWTSSYSYGNVFYVKGSQVSKSPPTGEFISKGSFMIYGKKEIIKVYNCNLGYCIFDEKLLLAPYRIINRLSNNNIKLTPRNDIQKMKSKKLIETLKKCFNISISENLFIFNKPCNIQVKKN